MSLAVVDPPQTAAPASPWLAYGVALAAVAVATVLAILADKMTVIPDLSLIFVLPVVVVAASYGWKPAMVSAVAGVAAVNFFLVAPRYSLRVEDPANVWSLGLLLVVAAIVSTVAAQAHRRAAEALDHADQALALQGLARGLMIAPDSQTILRLVAEASARVFKAPAVALAATPQGWASASEPPNQPLTASDTDAAQWALASKLASRADAYPMDASRYDFWPVITPRGVQAAIGLALRDRDAERPAVPERLVEIVGGYLAVALERERLAGEAIEARVNREGERLKADLLAAVSHDLRTPLSTIVFSLQSLRRFSGKHDAQAKAELLALTETEAVKLAGMVEGLLDMSRIDGGVVAARPGAQPLAELVDGALRRMQGALANHTLIAQPPPIGLTVSADPVLAESALANVLENAAKYSPAGSTITVRCEVRDGQAVVEVLDEGEGFGGPTEPLFAKFVRGVEGDGRPAGSGLGLSIARGFLEAQGGRIEAGDRVGGGAWVRLFLPLAEPKAVTP